MNLTRLTDRGVEPSALGFGGAPIGNLYSAVDDPVAEATLREAWASGIRYFDTAPHYGLGLSEDRFGRILTRYPRGELTISTKVGRLLVPHPAPTGSDLDSGGFAVPDRFTRRTDYSRAGVRRSLDASMRRLGTDYIDIVYVHDPEWHVTEALEHALPTLYDLRDEGVVKAVGVAMNMVEPLRAIAMHSDIDAVMIAGRWTLLDRTARPLLDECRARGIAVISAAPFNSGLLAEIWPADDARYGYLPAARDDLARARELARRCVQTGTTLPEAALQFPFRHPAVVSVVVGLRSPAETRQAADRMRRPLDDDIWLRLGLEPEVGLPAAANDLTRRGKACAWFDGGYPVRNGPA